MVPVLVASAAILCALVLSLFYGISEVRRRTGARGQEQDGEQLVADGLEDATDFKTKREAFKVRQRSTVLGGAFSALTLAALALTLFLINWHDSAGSENPEAATAGCTPPTADERIAFFGNLYGFTHPILTAVPKAQKLFDQGLLLAYNFNQYEAFQAFSMAAGLDPASPMAPWGVAYSLGPGANREVVEDETYYPSFNPKDFPACYDAAQKALALARRAAEGAATAAPEQARALAEKELAYAEAQAARFPAGSALQPARNVAQRRYSELMEGIGRRYGDADALALAAEGLMNLRQWDYYEPGGGALRPDAARAEALIQAVLERVPSHALAHHLHIHIAEGGRPGASTEELAAARAELSGEAMTFKDGPWAHSEGAAMGHLVHMPGHIFVRLGRWKDAVTANIRAYEADAAFTRACMMSYGPEHNTDMLIYAANMGGMVGIAEGYGAKLRGYQEELHTAAYGDATREWAHLVLTQVMFGKWDDVLTIAEAPPTARGQCPLGGPGYAAAVFHYARTLALAAKADGAGRGGFGEERERLLGLAQAELALLQAAEERVIEVEPTVPGEGPGVYGCDYKTLARLHSAHAAARLHLLTGQPQAAVATLEAAAAVEDAMAYMEPPRLYQPIRHCLGYVQLNVTGDYIAAERAYREDLAELPNNGWSLLGLGQALAAQQKPDQAAEAERLLSQEFPAAWKDADISLDSSCLAFSRV